MNTILTKFKNKDQSTSNQQLEMCLEVRTNNLKSICSALKICHENWIHDLERYRDESKLLKLFSNRQIMIMIILLTSSIHNQTKRVFLKKLYNNFTWESRNQERINEQEQQLTVECLSHYLKSLRISECNLSVENLLRLYDENRIQHGDNIDLCLKKLCQFLKEMFYDSKQLYPPLAEQLVGRNLKHGKNTTTMAPPTHQNEQYLVTFHPKTNNKSLLVTLEHDLDMETWCILLHIFNNKFPSSYQILWGSISTEEDILLFYSRIRTFIHLTFVVLDIDKMHHRLREILLNEQDSLTRQKDLHAEVYYFSRELTCRKGMKPYIIPRGFNADVTRARLNNNYQLLGCTPPQIKTIVGRAGIGT
ncbi:unnamed protein product [Didymodactylos carnosus]|uniref:Uncharacterized protein n=1 Tax=Didymodactylos carnosus TaxID=1234261 RepID=A0A8S2DVW0_9BILA|nr:unnamed protein product [Didymodactylos carnosus]CAF3766076.1 unnamed protein product [Didymodactylos carnosus]